MKHYRLSAVVWKEGEQYVSRCPELGVSSFGDSPGEAVEKLAQATEFFLKNVKELGIMSQFKPALDSMERFSTTIEVS